MARYIPLDLSEHLPYLVNRVGSALVARFSADALARARLSIASWRVLAVLADKGRLRQTDLAELTSIDVSTLSRLITRLVGDGLVQRTRSKRDSREVAVGLTRKGKALMARLVPVAAGLQNAATRDLSKQDIATLKRVLRKMHENLSRCSTPSAHSRVSGNPVPSQYAGTRQDQDILRRNLGPRFRGDDRG